MSDDQILDATERLVAAEGPHGVTLDEVARAVGVSAPAILKRFGSRRALLLALVARGAMRAGAPFEAARDRAPTRLGALLDGLTADLRHARSPEAVARGLAFLQVDLTDAEFRKHAREYFTRLRAAVTKLLDDAVRDGELARCDTRELARAVEVAYNGSVISWAIRGEGSAEAALRHDVERVLAPHRRSR